MASLDDMSPEQLQEYLKWAKGEGIPSSPGDANSMAEDSQFLAKNAADAEAPVAKLGDVLDPAKLSPPTPNAQDIVNSKSIPGKTAADSASVFEEAGHTSLPIGKSAAESAEVLANAPELKDPVLKQLASKFPTRQALSDFLAKAKGMIPETGEEAMYALGRGVGATGRLAAKVAGPASLAYEALKSTPAGAEDQDYSPSTLALMKQQKEGGPSRLPSDSSENKNIFQGVSDRYKALTPAMSAPKADDSEDDSEDESRSPAASSTKAAPSAPAGPQLQASTGPSPLDRLKEAQDRADRLTMINQLGKAGAQIGSGIAGAGGKGIVAPTQTDTKAFDTNIALAQQLPGRVEEQLKMERQDPKSQVSTSARDFIKNTLKINIPENISADQLKEQFPVIEKYLQAQENARVRIEAAKQHNEMIQALKNQGIEQKNTTQDNHDFAKLGEKLTSGLASSRNTLGRTDNTIRAAKALEGLKARIKDPNNMTTNEIAELATGVNSMLTQGMGSDHGVKMILPTSAQGDMSKISSYISNIPKGAQQGEFVNRLYNTIATEKNIALQLQNKIKGEVTAGYSHLQAHDPDRWSKLMAVHHLGTEDSGVASPSPEIQAPQQSSPKAGSIVKVRGKTYQVGADGDSLTEIQQ